MASIIDRNGRKYAQFYDADRSPSRKRFSLRTSDLSDARRTLIDLEDAFEAGKFDPWAEGAKSDPFGYEDAPTSDSLTDVIDRFTRQKQKQGRSDRTVQTYRRVWSRFAKRVDPNAMSDLSAGDVSAFVHDEGVSQATRCKRWRHLRAVLNHAGASGLLNDIHAPQSADKLPTPVRKDDLDAIESALKADYRQKRRKQQASPRQMIWAIPVFRFVFYSGLRSTELGRLKWKHIDPERGHIRITEQKNNKAQTVPLVSKAREALQSAPKPRETDMYVFRTPNGPLRQRNPQAFGGRCSRRFASARDLAGVDSEKTFHDLRAGFATALADAGMSAHQIKRAMRHSSLEMALKYVRVSNQKLKADMEAAL